MQKAKNSKNTRMSQTVKAEVEAVSTLEAKQNHGSGQKFKFIPRYIFESVLD